MSSYVLREYDQRVHRIAFPKRSAATGSLVDPGEESELATLIATTSAIDRHRSGEARIILAEDDYVGDHREYILAPFAFPGPSRFSDGTFGVLYTAEDRETAVQEATHRLTRTYEDGNAPPQETRKQHLTLRLVANDLADARASVVPGIDKRIYDSTSYFVSQKFGAAVREKSPGLTYDSVRRATGTCIGAFVPRICHDVRLVARIDVVWNGRRFTEMKPVIDL